MVISFSSVLKFSHRRIIYDYRCVVFFMERVKGYYAVIFSGSLNSVLVVNNDAFMVMRLPSAGDVNLFSVYLSSYSVELGY